MIEAIYFNEPKKLGSMIPLFDGNGNLPPGIYTPSLEEFKSRFVLDIPESQTRTNIYSGYITYCCGIIQYEIVSKNFVDGSFTTSKVDPNDVDVVVYFDAFRLNSIQNREEIKTRYLEQHLPNAIHRPHVLSVPVYPSHDPRYILTFVQSQKWINLISRDKTINRNQKGYIEFDLSNQDYKREITEEGDGL